MRKAEYTEEPKALGNFEQGMIALFKVPKESVAKSLKKREKPASSERKPKRSDRD
jgi:hypothetical protein